MKKLTIFLLFLGMSSIATGEVSTRVCLTDGNTPLELADPNIPYIYQDIMVGTKLTIIVDSNVGERWDGGLYISGENRDYGLLSGRDYNDITFDWEGSRFEAAGGGAFVYDFWDDIVGGFDLHCDQSSVPGDWFVIDYTSTSTGSCTVCFYDYSRPDGLNHPVYCHVFYHVRTRDFDKDTQVGFIDFALFASHWLETGCVDPSWCEGTDLDTDGNVDSDDLMLFADYWLERTE